MLITDTLRNVHQEADLDPGVQEMIADHAADEARHHVFFRTLLYSIWPQLSRNFQSLALCETDTLINLYIEPDMASTERDLNYIGVHKSDTAQVLCETYYRGFTKKYAKKCSAAITEILRELTDNFTTPRQAQPTPFTGWRD